MPNVTPWLWFDTEGEEAAEFYTSVFPNSKIVEVTHYGSANPQQRGTVMTVTFEERDGRTTLTWHTLFLSPAMKDEYVGMGIEGGANSGLDQLGDVVAGLKQSAR